MASQRFQVGALVVYRRTEISAQPAPNARQIAPTPSGEGYSYCVDKYWQVKQINADGTLLVRTRGGGEHTVRADDPNLRHASFVERLMLARTFEPTRRSA